MKTKLVAISLITLLALFIAGGVVAYAYLKPVAAASEPIQAIPIAQTTTATTGTVNGDENAVYTIDQASSTAQFVIDEVLNGSSVTVVGSTNQVAGQIAVDPTAPATARIGTIQINARTLATDNENRNKAIANRILETDQYEYITFTPTALTGLSETATVGQSYTFQITGQLTIRDQTRDVTFAATVTPNADGTLGGTATTTLNYADWGITVPSVPIVTGLADSVTLQITFVARAN